VEVTFDLDVVRDERGFRLATGEVKESRMVSRIFASWNQMAAWLRGVATLQNAA
jgi:hypothetical protein